MKTETEIEQLIKEFELQSSYFRREAEKEKKYENSRYNEYLRKESDLVNKINELQQNENQHKEALTQYGEMLQAAGVCPICNRSTVDSCVQ